MTIIKRADLGRPLTWDELDDNFQQVDNLTAAASAAVSSASASATAAAGSATNSLNSANSAATSALDALNSSEVAINALMNSTFEPSDFDFTSGGTLDSIDRNKAVFNPMDNNWYSWAGTLPHVVAAGTDPVEDSNWTPRTDQLLRQDLARNTPISGATLSRLEQGGTVQSGIKYVTPQMFGSLGNYDPITDSGYDDTSAFKTAIAVAITLGYREVKVPEGFDYLITESLNLGGDGYTGGNGVALISSGFTNTNIYYRVPSANSACIEILGGSGLMTGRRVQGLVIQPTRATRYSGVGIRISGANFSKNSLLWIRQFGVGLHLLNNAAGVFTEQNKFSDIRFHRNLVDVLMETSGTGDDSFHGNDFKNCHFQVKTTVAGDDGNVQPGVALELRGSGSRPVYWYNSFFDVHMFGGAGATAIKLTRANTDNIKANILAEGGLILEATDASSSFESKGGFYSIGAVTMQAFSEPTSRLSQFVFENRQSNTSNFTSENLTGLTPRQFPLYAADRTDNGCAPFIFRVTSSSVDGIAYAAASTTGSNHYIGRIPSGGNLQSFIPGFKIAADGGSILSYGATFFLNSSGAGGVQIGNNIFAPRTDNSVACGSGAFRWSVVYAGSGVINTSDEAYKLFRDTPADITARERNAALTIRNSIKAYQFKESLEEKEGNARFHFGVGAQTVIQILKDNGLNPDDYAFIALEQWPDIFDNDGILVKESGSRWGVRYDELSMFILMNT